MSKKSDVLVEYLSIYVIQDFSTKFLLKTDKLTRFSHGFSVLFFPQKLDMISTDLLLAFINVARETLKCMFICELALIQGAKRF